MTEQLLDYARQRAGEYLRVVATYTETNYRLAYVRDDLRARYAEAHVRMVIDELVEGERVSERMRQSFGPQYASVRLFPDVCLVHLRTGGGDRGVVISLSEAAAANLAEFVRECADRWEPTPV